MQRKKREHKNTPKKCIIDRKRERCKNFVGSEKFRVCLKQKEEEEEEEDIFSIKKVFD